MSMLRAFFLFLLVEIGALTPATALCQDAAIQLTHDQSLCPYSPTWSPDGLWIAYVSDQGGDEDIWKVPVSGGQPVQITGMVSCHERDPDWSHAGDRIVFTTDPIVNVCTVAPDGAGLDTVPGGYGPCWSPADDFFAAVGGIGGPYMYVFTISLVEGNRFFPTFELPNHSDPDWSPDGASLVFEHMGDIYVVPSSGGTPICLTSGFSGEAYDPAWSPDGQYIAFGGGWDVWAVHLGTGTFSRVTAGPGNNGYPAWSPDGSSIAFISDRSGTLDVWLVPWDAPTAAQRTTWGAVKAVFK